MLERIFNEVYTKFKLNFYRNIFGGFENREATLTSTETFCVEVINALDKPNINKVANFLNVSQPNMTYKVNSLVKKGYVRKVNSDEDKREVYLEVTEKFDKYEKIKNQYTHKVITRTKERLSKEDLEKFTEILTIISDELMYEINEKIKK